MTSTEKKYKNREYYESNREVIKNRARERYHMQKRLEEKASAAPALTEALTLVPEALAIAEPQALKLCPGQSWNPRHGFDQTRDLYQQYEVKIVTQNIAVTNIASSAETVPEHHSRLAEEIPRYSQSAEVMQNDTESLHEGVKNEAPHTEKQAIGNESSAWSKGFLRILASPALFFQVLFITGITSILTAMQIGFYRAHDIFPGLAVPLAVACELSLLYLVSIRCSGLSNGIRVGLYALMFGYIVSSLSFDVFFQSRNQMRASTQSGPAATEARSELHEDLKKAEAALETAAKGRSWKNMALFGEQVSSIQKRLSEVHETKEFGVTDSEAMIAGAVLLVVLRALLMGVNSMAMCGLRNAVEINAEPRRWKAGSLTSKYP